MILASVPKIVEKTEIVPIHYSELQETKVLLPKKQTDSIAIHLEYSGFVLPISNDADADIIAATLKALRQLCQVICPVWQRYFLWPATPI